MNHFNSVAADVKLGKNVKLSEYVNLYGCEIGDETKIGALVEIQKNVSVGKRCKISSHTFICEGVVIEDNVFIGHGVMFINDSYPRATTQDWRASDRSRLESGEHVDRARRIHWIKRDDSFQGQDWRKRDCGRWQRRDEGCPAIRGRCGKPGKDFALS